MNDNLLLVQIKEQLNRLSYKLATAESCTGGKIASLMTEVDGSSAWFDRGFVTYSNQSKIDMLSVNLSTLEKHGAVSEQVAKEMAKGCLINSGCNISLSVTGIAGPTGGSKEKPVGTVWFAFAKKIKAKIIIQSRLKNFSGNRAQVREKSTDFAIKQLNSFIGL